MSAKKPPSKRHAPQPNAEATPATQPAAERKAAEAEIRRLIGTFSPENLRLVLAMRRLLHKRMPAAHEVVYEYRDCFVISYSPSVRGYEGVLAIRGSREGVRLYFNRARELQDPGRLLQGTGSRTRYVPVQSASSLTRAPIADFIQEAIAGNPVPLAASGLGSVVIRSASAKKGRRRGSAR